MAELRGRAGGSQSARRSPGGGFDYQPVADRLRSRPWCRPLSPREGPRRRAIGREPRS